MLNNRPVPEKPNHRFQICLRHKDDCSHHALVHIKDIFFDTVPLYFNNVWSTIIYSIKSFQQLLLGPHHLAGSNISELILLANLR